MSKFRKIRKAEIIVAAIYLVIRIGLFLTAWIQNELAPREASYIDGHGLAMAFIAFFAVVGIPCAVALLVAVCLNPELKKGESAFIPRNLRVTRICAAAAALTANAFFYLLISSVFNPSFHLPMKSLLFEGDVFWLGCAVCTAVSLITITVFCLMKGFAKLKIKRAVAEQTEVTTAE